MILKKTFTVLLNSPLEYLYHASLNTFTMLPLRIPLLCSYTPPLRPSPCSPVEDLYYAYLAKRQCMFDTTLVSDSVSESFSDTDTPFHFPGTRWGACSSNFSPSSGKAVRAHTDNLVVDLFPFLSGGVVALGWGVRMWLRR